ncbi:hypothetical protein DFP73DRAFT_530084 [Morchella snyderi]|nr:hypothetical protein DFP73DRAFT_530084 [Morchella snyderi]
MTILHHHHPPSSPSGPPSTPPSSIIIIKTLSKNLIFFFAPIILITSISYIMGSASNKSADSVPYGVVAPTLHVATTRDGTTRDGNTRDANTRDGNTRDGNTRDGNTRDGNTRDGNTRDGTVIPIIVAPTTLALSNEVLAVGNASNGRAKRGKVGLVYVGDSLFPGMSFQVAELYRIVIAMSTEYIPKPGAQLHRRHHGRTYMCGWVRKDDNDDIMHHLKAGKKYKPEYSIDQIEPCFDWAHLPVSNHADHAEPVATRPINHTRYPTPFLSPAQPVRCLPAACRYYLLAACLPFCI